MKRIITLLLFCVVSVFAFAQTGTVSGNTHGWGTRESRFLVLLLLSKEPQWDLSRTLMVRLLLKM